MTMVMDVTCSVESSVAESATRAETAALGQTYFWQGEFLALPELLPATLIDRIVDEVSRVRAGAVRRTIPGFKRSSSVAWPTLRAHAPTVASLFHSPALIRLLEHLTDARLVPAPDWDPHACAVYHYDRAGDGIGYHYDTSWYRGTRYTVLIGLVNRSTAHLSCDLHKREPQRPQRRVDVATEPGTMVLFHGDKLWHRVTPLAEGEVRTVLTLQYVTDARMSAIGRIISFAKDAMAYFGVRQVANAMFGGAVAPPAAALAENLPTSGPPGFRR